MVDAGGDVMLAQVLWQSPTLLPVAVATMGIVLAAVLWLYPPQMRMVPRPWRWLPPMLRAMAAGALTVSLVQPAVLRPRAQSEQGAVVVLVDGSRSMSVSDGGRTPGELVALAAGLGALPRGARPIAAPQLRENLEAARAMLSEIVRLRSEAEYARISGRPSLAAEERLKQRTGSLLNTLRGLDTPKSDALVAGAQAPAELLEIIAQLKQVPASLDEPALQALRGRLETAARTLSSFQGQLDQKLFESDERVRAICSTLARSTRLELVERALLDPTHGLLSNLGRAAPLSGFVFADAVEPAPSISPGRQTLDVPATASQSDVTGAPSGSLRRMRARPVQAIVALSDGRQVGGEESADLSALGAPVFTVSVAAPLRRDISLTAMDAPSSARIGEPTAVRVELSGVGVRGETVEVRLDAGDVREIRRVALGEESSAGVEFVVTPRSAGAMEMVARVLPLAGEVSEANNVMRRWLKVATEPLRVTVIAAADAGKQYASLHEALSRAAWVTLREVEEDEAYRLSPAAIVAQDVVILCDLPPEALSRTQWSALEQLVRQRGGSVVMTAGAHLPGAYAEHDARDWLPQDTPLAWRTWPGGEPHFRVLPAPSPQSSAAQRGWRNLSAVSALAAVASPRSGVQPLLIERESGDALVTESTRAIGRVFYVGTDETWRWRGRADAHDVHQFWPGLLRRAAPEPYAAVEGNLSLDAQHVDVEPGEPLALRARVLTGQGFAADAPTQLVDVLQGNQRVATVTLKLTSEGLGRYAGVMEGLAEGDYVLRLEAPEDPSMEVPPDPVELALHVRRNYEAEMTDLSGDERTLRRMAESSGGTMIPLEQISSLPQLLADNRAKQSQLVEYRLWDSPYLFVFVLACLSAEWSLRKKFGLA